MSPYIPVILPGKKIQTLLLLLLASEKVLKIPLFYASDPPAERALPPVFMIFVSESWEYR